MKTGLPRTPTSARNRVRRPRSGKPAALLSSRSVRAARQLVQAAAKPRQPSTKAPTLTAATIRKSDVSAGADKGCPIGKHACEANASLVQIWMIHASGAAINPASRNTGRTLSRFGAGCVSRRDPPAPSEGGVAEPDGGRTICASTFILLKHVGRQVQRREDEQPHDVDKMPVQATDRQRGAALARRNSRVRSIAAAAPARRCPPARAAI